MAKHTVKLIAGMMHRLAPARSAAAKPAGGRVAMSISAPGEVGGPHAANGDAARARAATLIDRCVTAYHAGDSNALFDLGVVFSAGTNGVSRDLVEAHKWFYLAAASGHREAGLHGAEIASSLSPREIAESQRRARGQMITSPQRAAWLPQLRRKGASAWSAA